MKTENIYLIMCNSHNMTFNTLYCDAQTMQDFNHNTPQSYTG